MPSIRNPLSPLVHAALAGKIALLAAVGAALLLCGGSFVGVAVVGGAWTDSQWRGALAAVVDAPADTIDPALDGALIRVVAEAAADAAPRDPLFAVEAPDGVALLRVVETFQWIEEDDTHRTGSGRRARTTRTKRYHQDWSPTLVDSSTFRQPEGHENPTSVPHTGDVVLGAGARIGAYGLTAEVIHALPALDPVSLTADHAAAAGGRLHEGHIHLHPTPQQPAVGAQRISYRVLPPRQITVLAMQDAGHLRPWPQPPSPPVLLAQPGDVRASEMVWAQRRSTLQSSGMLSAIGMFICAFAAFPLFMAGAIVVVTATVHRIARRPPPDTNAPKR